MGIRAQGPGVLPTRWQRRAGATLCSEHRHNGAGPGRGAVRSRCSSPLVTREGGSGSSAIAMLAQAQGWIPPWSWRRGEERSWASPSAAVPRSIRDWGTKGQSCRDLRAKGTILGAAVGCEGAHGRAGACGAAVAGLGSKGTVAVALRTGSRTPCREMGPEQQQPGPSALDPAALLSRAGSGKDTARGRVLEAGWGQPPPAQSTERAAAINLYFQDQAWPPEPASSSRLRFLRLQTRPGPPPPGALRGGAAASCQARPRLTVLP